jgi:hypothetical protein
MPEARLFAVRCKGCGRSLVTVRRLRDPEIAILEDHLRACGEPLGDAHSLGDLMAKVRVAVARA